jgi:dienelactone hydrolase
VPAIPGFEEIEFEASGISRPVYRRGDGPGVILLHELPGLTVETRDFADWLVARGLHVVMPLLFGRPLQSVAAGLARAPLLCLRREFVLFTAGKASPIAGWLRDLCRCVHARCGGPGVGLIGMCLTGGFVLSTMVEASVAAPVAAQPSLPLLRSGGVDADADTLRRAAARAAAAPLLALRFEDDWRVPAARLDVLREAFCGGHRRCARFAEVIVPGRGHATLTFDYATAKARGVDTRQVVLDHLRGLLNPGGAA